MHKLLYIILLRMHKKENQYTLVSFILVQQAQRV